MDYGPAVSWRPEDKQAKQKKKDYFNYKQAMYFRYVKER
jgi:hypothetical protein